MAGSHRLACGKRVAAEEFIANAVRRPWSAVARHRPQSIWNDDVDEPNNEVCRSALIAALLELRGSLFQSNEGLRRAAALQGGRRLTPSGSTAASGSRRGKSARSLFGETMIECRDWSRTVETESVVARSCPRANAHRLAKTKSVGEPVAVRPRTTRHRRNGVNC